MRRRQGQPDTKQVKRRQADRAAGPGQRELPEGEAGQAAQRQDGERRHADPRQNGAGDGQRRQDQDREGILETAGQVKQQRKLKRVIAQIKGGVAVGQPGPGASLACAAKFSSTEAPMAASAGPKGSLNPKP